MSIKSKLISELTRMDDQHSKKKGHNPHAIAIYFQAVDRVEEDVKNGMSWEKAFALNFNATREMLSVAKNCKFSLDVQRGDWVHVQG